MCVRSVIAVLLAAVVLSSCGAAGITKDGACRWDESAPGTAPALIYLDVGKYYDLAPSGGAPAGEDGVFGYALISSGRNAAGNLRHTAYAVPDEGYMDITLYVAPEEESAEKALRRLYCPDCADRLLAAAELGVPGVVIVDTAGANLYPVAPDTAFTVDGLTVTIGRLADGKLPLHIAAGPPE